MKLRTLLLAGFFLFAGIGYSQVPMITEPVEVKPKPAIFIPKIDLFWGTVTAINNFPATPPLELEVNFPHRYMSVGVVVSGWRDKYTVNEKAGLVTFSSYNAESQLIAGIYGRYYFVRSESANSATGFFLEPEFFMRRSMTSVDTVESGGNIVNPVVNRDFEMAVALAPGYQKLIGERIMLYAKCSIGFTNAEYMRTFQVSPLIFLPWAGIGYRIN